MHFKSKMHYCKRGHSEVIETIKEHKKVIWESCSDQKRINHILNGQRLATLCMLDTCHLLLPINLFVIKSLQRQFYLYKINTNWKHLQYKILNAQINYFLNNNNNTLLLLLATPCRLLFLHLFQLIYFYFK